MSARAVALLLAAATSVACASGGSTSASRSSASASGASDTTTIAWPVKTWEHVDIWLHGFALLMDDSAKVPFFRSNYAAEITAYKDARNVRTRLDENRQRLKDRFSISASLTNAQFLGIYFGSWSEMKEFMNYFFVADGDPRRASNREVQRAISIIGGYFRSAADRDWARLFMQSLEDEYDEYYHAWWTSELQRRQHAFATVDSLWQRTYYPKLKRYLDGSQQRRGDVLLSLPLNGEGRLVPGSATSPGGNYSYLAVNSPETAERAVEAIYVMAHELSGKVVTVAVNDHTTPAEDRAGIKSQYETDGLVVGGYLLLKRVVPELADGYARYYLQAVGAGEGGEGVESALLKAFPLPDLIRESIARQINLVMSGI